MSRTPDCIIISPQYTSIVSSSKYWCCVDCRLGLSLYLYSSRQSMCWSWCWLLSAHSYQHLYIYSVIISIEDSGDVLTGSSLPHKLYKQARNSHRLKYFEMLLLLEPIQVALSHCAEYRLRFGLGLALSQLPTRWFEATGAISLKIYITTDLTNIPSWLQIILHKCREETGCYFHSQMCWFKKTQLIAHRCIMKTSNEQQAKTDASQLPF